MDTAQHSCVIEVDWLAASPIGPHAVAFKCHLTERRYAAHTVSSYVAEVAHFARWVCTRRLPLARIEPPRFLRRLQLLRRWSHEEVK